VKVASPGALEGRRPHAGIIGKADGVGKGKRGPLFRRDYLGPARQLRYTTARCRQAKIEICRILIRAYKVPWAARPSRGVRRGRAARRKEGVMDRPKVYALLGLLAAALLAGGATLTAGDKKDAGSKKRVEIPTKAFDQCAKACGACAGECERCLHHCVKMLAAGKKDHERTLRSCADCAEICVAAARIMARRGPFSLLICEPCAQACARCAANCEQHASDPVMAACARACRDCEKACRDMLKYRSTGKPTTR
jgi:hypothetical protein